METTFSAGRTSRESLGHLILDSNGDSKMTVSVTDCMWARVVLRRTLSFWIYSFVFLHANTLGWPSVKRRSPLHRSSGGFLLGSLTQQLFSTWCPKVTKNRTPVQRMSSFMWFSQSFLFSHGRRMPQEMIHVRILTSLAEINLGPEEGGAFCWCGLERPSWFQVPAGNKCMRG